MITEEYLIQYAGLTAFFDWLAEKEIMGIQTDYDKNIVCIDQIISKTIAIGIDKNKKKELEVFLAIPTDIKKWLSLISWEKIYLSRNQKAIYIASNVIEGDHQNFLDLPQLTIKFLIDEPSKFDLFELVKTISCREYFFDGNEIKVNFHKCFFNIPIEIIKNEKDILIKQGEFNYDNLLSSIENNLQSEFNYIPELRGNVYFNQETKNIF